MWMRKKCGNNSPIYSNRIQKNRSSRCSFLRSHRNLAGAKCTRNLQRNWRICRSHGTSRRRSEEHTSELQSLRHLVCRLLLEKKNKKYYLSVAEIFERWVERRTSPHTRRAYRQDVMAFVEHLGIVWPHDATAPLQLKVADVLG